MIEGISAWIKNIILLVLFASFLELLLPSSSMQRFIRVIIGLLITLAILNPVLDVIQNRWSTAQIPALSTNTANSQSVMNNANKVAGDREQLAFDTYKKELARQIRATTTAIEGIADAQVAVELENPQQGKFNGKVRALTIYVKPGVNNAKGKIEPVVIGTTNYNEAIELKPQLKTKILQTIYELYQIPNEHIEIKLLH
ncbi:stage III sporulation protein AF [Sporomusaceae bacterium FL31]|nr:stage III sporulation protein AF [Sporomusaceae bacterium FL31]GCE33286.1 stage III sporulation protein AF [Sporomusaceae bacterium]